MRCEIGEGVQAQDCHSFGSENQWEATDKVYKKLGKKRWARVEVVGFSGSVCVLWDKEEVELRLLIAQKSFIYMKVRSENGLGWMLMAVYANLHPNVRRFL